MSTAEDFYPSRNGASTGIWPRLDPVVYRDNLGDAPIEPGKIEQYREQGFVLLDGVFSAEEVGAFQRELHRLCTDTLMSKRDETIIEPGSGAVRSIFKIHVLSPLFRRLAADHRLAGLARYILDDDVYIHQSRLNAKPGFRGKEFYWHSDFETWHVEDGMPRMRALSMSVTLTENFSYNGPLMLVPGSHMNYVACEGLTPELNYRKSLRQQKTGVPQDDCLRQMVEEGGIVAATGKPGSVIVFDSNVMHGSNGNITPLPRSNLFFVYNAMSNRLRQPYCGLPPRPEFLAARDYVEAIDVCDNDFVEDATFTLPR